VKGVVGRGLGGLRGRLGEGAGEGGDGADLECGSGAWERTTVKGVWEGRLEAEIDAWRGQ
jgi:hypothetical protein